jgi:hypothetical protein
MLFEPCREVQVEFEVLRGESEHRKRRSLLRASAQASEDLNTWRVIEG